MSILRRLLDMDAIEQQQKILELQREIARLKLEHLRQVRDLIEQFWIVQESGQDARETLWAGLNDMRDHVARLEEHTR